MLLFDNALSYRKPIGFTGIALVILYIFMVGKRGGLTDHRKQVVIGTGDVAVQAGEYTSHYKFLEEIDAPFLVTAVYPKNKRNNPIRNYHSQFLTFSSKTIRRYMEKCDNTKDCTASFLNHHAKSITLYAANPKIAEKLANWKQEDATVIANWGVINISGQCLEGRTKIEKNGEDVTDSFREFIFGKGPFRDCNTIYVTKIDSADMSVEAFMERASNESR